MDLALVWAIAARGGAIRKSDGERGRREPVAVTKDECADCLLVRLSDCPIVSGGMEAERRRTGASAPGIKIRIKIKIKRLGA